MVPPDKPSIMRILKATPEFKPGEIVVAEELIDCYLEDPSGLTYPTLVAEINSKVVGYICYGPTPLTEGTWDIYWMAVARGQRGRGIGSALLTSAEKKMKGSRGRLAFIETSSKPEYEKTRNFYRSRGYELVCRIDDFYAPGDDKLILVKRLPP
jgi:ribosomal protein S18 acetylase RimI-like enzyme